MVAFGLSEWHRYLATSVGKLYLTSLTRGVLGALQLKL